MDLNLKITQLKPYNQYVLLETKSQKTYTLVLEFYGVEKPKINDILVLNEKLLDPKFQDYCQPYAFAPFEKSDKIGDESELIGLVCKGKNTF